LKNKKGFTLIELVVILAIMSIVAGIAYPSLKAYKENAEKLEMEKHEEIINKAIVQYYAFTGRYPEAATDSKGIKSNILHSDTDYVSRINQLRDELMRETNVVMNTDKYQFDCYVDADGLITSVKAIIRKND